MSDHMIEPSEALLLTATQARLRLGIGLTKFNRIVASGDLPVVWLGGSRLVRSDDLRRFVDGLAKSTIAKN